MLTEAFIHRVAFIFRLLIKIKNIIQVFMLTIAIKKNSTIDWYKIKSPIWNKANQRTCKMDRNIEWFKVIMIFEKTLLNDIDRKKKLVLQMGFHSFSKQKNFHLLLITLKAVGRPAHLCSYWASVEKNNDLATWHSFFRLYLSYLKVWIILKTK